MKKREKYFGARKRRFSFAILLSTFGFSFIFLSLVLLSTIYAFPEKEFVREFFIGIGLEKKSFYEYGEILLSDIQEDQLTITPSRLGNHVVPESSGVAASHVYPGVYWMMPDSPRIAGTEINVYAVNGTTGATIKEFDVVNGYNRDWEDIDIDENNNIWIAETGDNSQVYGIYRYYVFPEPNPYGASNKTASAIIYNFNYPDGNKDSEGTFIWKGHPYMVQKRPTNARVYWLSEINASKTVTAQFIGEFNNGGQWITGADISDDGRRLALINDGADYHWIIERNYSSGSISDFFNYSIKQWRMYFFNNQGEAIGFVNKSYDFVVASEQGDFWRVNQSVYDSVVACGNGEIGSLCKCGSANYNYGFCCDYEWNEIGCFEKNCSDADWRSYQINQSNEAGYATLSYSPEGDLRIFYSENRSNNWALVYRKKNNTEKNFENEIIVASSSADMRLVSAVYLDNKNITLSAETDGYVGVYYSNDSGLNWQMNKTYTAKSGAEGSYLPSFVTKDGDNLHLFYNFLNYNPVIGYSKHIYKASRISNVWDSAGTFLADSEDFINCAYEEGNDILVIGSKIHLSNDNGNSFLTIGDFGEIPDRLNGITSCYRENGGRIYIARQYSYGVAPYDKHVRIYYSDDFGQNWNLIKTFDYAENILSPKIAVEGSFMAVVWGINDGLGDISRIDAEISGDGGQTWSENKTIVLPAKSIRSRDQKEDIYLAARNGSVHLAYSLKNGANREGVYISQCSYNVTGSSTGNCVDADADGYNTTIGACGVVADCNDSNESIHPGALELCDGVDNNCVNGADNIACSEKKQVILVGVDGFQNNHYKEMLNAGLLPNFQRLMINNGWNGTANITGHSNTETAPGNAELHSGLNQTLNGISSNGCGVVMTGGKSVLERLHNFNSSIPLGLVYGKTTCYIPDSVLANAKPLANWWHNRTTYPQTQFASANCAYAQNVSAKASEFIGNYSNTSFFLVVYFGDTDCAGHTTNENNALYDTAILNVNTGLGILLDALATYGIENSTQIILSADHGWNEGTNGHGTSAPDTLILPLVTNNKSMTEIIYSMKDRKQCDIAPTILNYFGMNSSDYSDITGNGCGSMINNTALSIFCGDLICNGIENCSSCPQDCGCADTTAPNIFLLNPEAGSITENSLVYFNALFADNVNVSNASLYVYNSSGKWIGAKFIGIGNATKAINISYVLNYSGTFYWNFLAYDNSSNRAFSSNNFSLIYSPADIIAPMISSVTNTTITNSSAVIRWQTDENATSKVYYGLTTAFGLSVSDASYLISHIINLGNLGVNSTYYYKVGSCDASGNCANSSIYNFKTLDENESYVDNEAPVIVLGVPANATSLGTNSVTFTYTPSDYSVILNCTLFVGVESRVDDAIEKNLENSFVLSLANGDYSWNISCRDARNILGVSETRRLNVNYVAPPADSGGSGGGGGGGGGSLPVIKPKPKAENVTNTSVAGVEKERIMLEEGVSFVDANGEEKVLVDLYGNVYLVSFVLVEGEIVAKLFNGDYVIPRGDVLPIALGEGEVYAGIVDDEKGERVVLGLDENSVRGEVLSAEGWRNINYKKIYYVLIIVVGTLIAAIIALGIWYFISSRKEEENNIVVTGKIWRDK